MTDSKKVGDLEIDQDLEFQRRDWRAQRAGWVIMLLLILGSLAGFFGRGPVAHASAGGTPLRVEYDRLLRHQADAEMLLRLAPGATAGQARIQLDSALLDAIRIERLTPEPESETATREGVVFAFAVDDAESPLAIRVDYRATGYWSEHGTIALGEQPPLRLDFFVYP